MATVIVSRSDRRRRRLSRRRFIKGLALGTLGFCSACAVDAWGIEPEWLEVVECDLSLGNLPDAFIGKRLIQISDLHLSRTVSEEYLRRCIQRVNSLEGDIVVLTGDYITADDQGRSCKRVIELIGQLRAGLGVFACLGNHDYGVTTSWTRPNERLCEYFVNSLRHVGVNVLRNESFPLVLDSQRCWLVGLGDLWAAECRPDLAFAGVTADEVTIVLSHNPDSVEKLAGFDASAVLSGHTHGGQVRLPFLGPPILPIKNRQYSAGMFELADTTLYVNRGLGRLGRLRFNCRPEITVFTLRTA